MTLHRGGYALLALLTAAAPCALAADISAPKGVDYYKDVRGAIVFKTYCVLCHGTKADGNGRAAGNYDPRPADLTRSTAPDEYKELIIRRGGAAIGRSQHMPPWGQELTDEQIRDVIYYLGVINVKHRSRRSAAAADKLTLQQSR